jgi:spore coat polysaccharide biosynthesis predicted glycosyltransferase SpsG
MKILIRAYGSHLMGMGHLYRMKNLVDKIRQSVKCEMILITRVYDEAKNIYNQINVDKVFEIEKDFNDIEEIKYLSMFKENEFDICINDQLNTYTQIAVQLNIISKKSITFDDKGGGNVFFHKVINVLYPSEVKLDNENNSYEYLIINNFSDEKNNYKLNNKVKSIFINQGAADTWGAIPNIINDLNSIPKNIKLIVLLGPSFKHFDDLAVALSKSNKKIELYNSVDSVIQIAKKCDLAILGAGNTLFEIASLGVPIIASTREKKELITINRLINENLVLSSGEIYKSGLDKLVLKLMNDNESRKLLSGKCKKVLTYNGLNNIINLILKD